MTRLPRERKREACHAEFQRVGLRRRRAHSDSHHQEHRTTLPIEAKGESVFTMQVIVTVAEVIMALVAVVTLMKK